MVDTKGRLVVWYIYVALGPDIVFFFGKSIDAESKWGSHVCCGRNFELFENNKGKKYTISSWNESTVEGYTYADYAGSLVDRRSTIGYCIFLGGNHATWRSKKQYIVRRSIDEAEFHAIALGMCELLWLKIILDDLKISKIGSVQMFLENKPEYGEIIIKL